MLVLHGLHSEKILVCLGLGAMLGQNSDPCTSCVDAASCIITALAFAMYLSYACTHGSSIGSKASLLGGSWGLVTSYDWAYDPIYSLIVSLTGILWFL